MTLDLREEVESKEKKEKNPYMKTVESLCLYKCFEDAKGFGDYSQVLKASRCHTVTIGRDLSMSFSHICDRSRH